MKAASAGRLQLQFVNYFYVKENPHCALENGPTMTVAFKPLMRILQWILIVHFHLSTSAAELHQSFIVAEGDDPMFVPLQMGI